MALEIVRFKDLTSDHAEQLRELVFREQRMLRERYFLGVLAGYGASREMAHERFAKVASADQKATPTSGDMSFGVIDTTTSLSPNALVGAATATRGLPLRTLRLPIPPRFAIGPLAHNYPLETPATVVTGWMRPLVGTGSWYAEESLPSMEDRDVERLASIHTAVIEQLGPDEHPWTIEPINTPYSNLVFNALERAGFRGTGERPARYDVGERETPPRSLVFLHPSAEEVAAQIQSL